MKLKYMKLKYILFIFIGIFIYFILNNFSGFSVGIPDAAAAATTRNLSDPDHRLLVAEQDIKRAIALAEQEFAKKYTGGGHTRPIYITDNNGHWVIANLLRFENISTFIVSHDIFEYNKDTGKIDINETNTTIEVEDIGTTWIPFEYIPGLGLEDNIFTQHKLDTAYEIIQKNVEDFHKNDYPDGDATIYLEDEEAHIKKIFYISQKYHNKSLKEFMDSDDYSEDFLSGGGVGIYILLTGESTNVNIKKNTYVYIDQLFKDNILNYLANPKDTFLFSPIFGINITNDTIKDDIIIKLPKEEVDLDGELKGIGDQGWIKEYIYPVSEKLLGKYIWYITRSLGERGHPQDLGRRYIKSKIIEILDSEPNKIKIESLETIDGVGQYGKKGYKHYIVLIPRLYNKMHGWNYYQKLK